MLCAVLGLIHLFKGPQEESRLRKETSLKAYNTLQFVPPVLR